MSTSVGTKTRKKQPALKPLASANTPLPSAAIDKDIEQALLALENACITILDCHFTAAHDDSERLHWQRRFKNIATPVSLALVECKGPRRFHYHYRHRTEDESVLYPVLEPNPLSMLARVCRQALRRCDGELVGIEERAIVQKRDLLERALRGFLLLYGEA